MTTVLALVKLIPKRKISVILQFVIHYVPRPPAFVEIKKTWNAIIPI